MVLAIWKCTPTVSSGYFILCTEGYIKKNLVIITVCILLLCGSAYAEDCNYGIAAYVAGNYQKALSIFAPLAAKGDDCAQYQLGEMYKLGQGVTQDKQKALELFDKAAAQGNQKAKIQKSLLEK